jgi:hypothetical protein
MIDDFARPAWADAHEKFAADVIAGLTRLGRWLRRRAKAKNQTPAVTPRRGKDGRRCPEKLPSCGAGAESQHADSGHPELSR